MTVTTVDLFDSLVPLTAAAFTATLAAKSLADLKGPTVTERAQGLSGKPLTVREQKALEESAGAGGVRPRSDREGPAEDPVDL
jgi:hypothetical protein